MEKCEYIKARVPGCNGISMNLTVPSEFSLESGISSVLGLIFYSVVTKVVCIFTRSNELKFVKFPEEAQVFSINCDEEFLELARQGVREGCAFFITTESCTENFLEKFRDTQDYVLERYDSKFLTIIGTKQPHEFFFDLSIIKEDLPQTIVIYPDENEDDDDDDDVIKIWYMQEDVIYNRFFRANKSLMYDKKFYPVMKDLKGRQVVVAGMKYPPYSYYSDVTPGIGTSKLKGSTVEKSVLLQGVEYLIMMEFCKKYNCNIEILPESSEWWGEVFADNRTGTGSLGAIMRREADIAMSGLYHWSQVFPFMKFTDSVQKTHLYNIVPKMKPLPTYLIPFLPFSIDIWVYIVMAYLFGIILIHFAKRFSLKFLEEDATRKNYTFGEIVMMILKLSLFEGISVIQTNTIGEYLVFTVLFYFAMIIGNLYGGGLASVMTVTRYEKSIDNVRDLIESDLKWGGTSILFILSILPTEDPILRHYLDSFQIFTSMEELHEHVIKQDMAVVLEVLQYGSIVYDTYLDVEAAKNYMLAKEEVYWEQTVFVTSQTWPFMSMLNQMILMQSESGIGRIWEWKESVALLDDAIETHLRQNGRPIDGGEPVRLSVEHIIGAICFWAIGCGLSVIVFVIEVFWGTKKRE